MANETFNNIFVRVEEVQKEIDSMNDEDRIKFNRFKDNFFLKSGKVHLDVIADITDIKYEICKEFLCLYEDSINTKFIRHDSKQYTLDEAWEKKFYKDNIEYPWGRSN